MHRFVVLLRGVNVGKANRVPMAEFRELLEAAGYSQIRTLLNSGNAVFGSAGRSASKHAAAIGRAMRVRLGISVPVMVKSSDEFAAVVAGNPFAPPEDQHARFLVAFSQDEQVLQELSVIEPLVLTAEHFTIGPRAAYLYCPQGINESKAAAALLGRVGRAVTTRNWATVLKLHQLLRSDTD